MKKAVGKGLVVAGAVLQWAAFKWFDVTPADVFPDYEGDEETEEEIFGDLLGEDDFARVGIGAPPTISAEARELIVDPDSWEKTLLVGDVLPIDRVLDAVDELRLASGADVVIRR